MDVLLVRVAAEHELQLGRGHQLAHDVDDVVADDPLGGGEVADAHADDPALDRRRARVCVAPLLDVRCIGTSSGSQWFAFIVR